MYFPREQEAVTFWIHIKLLVHPVPQIRKREMGKKKNLSFRKSLFPKSSPPINKQISLGQIRKILKFWIFFSKAPLNTETITTYHIRVVLPVKITCLGVSGHQIDIFISWMVDLQNWHSLALPSSIASSWLQFLGRDLAHRSCAYSALASFSCPDHILRPWRI